MSPCRRATHRGWGGTAAGRGTAGSVGHRSCRVGKQVEKRELRDGRRGGHLPLVCWRYVKRLVALGLQELVDGGGDGAVAERFERQDGEWLLDLDPDLLDAQQEEGEQRRDRDGQPVVPRVAHHRPDSEWQAKEKGGKES
eukprot:scaffold1728_cov116-Isochrysis_galbana.AAC.5